MFNEEQTETNSRIENIIEQIRKSSGEKGKAAVPKSEHRTIVFRNNKMYKIPQGTPPPTPEN